jgi:hypothetical protein
MAIMFAFPAAAQKVSRPPAAPAAVGTEKQAQFTQVESGLNGKADLHDVELAAYARECPAMPKTDPRVSGCQSKREAVLTLIRPYNGELQAYRGDARSALQAVIGALDAELASVQNAIRNIGFNATTAASEDFEKLSEKGKAAMVDEAIGSVLTLVGSQELGDKLGEVFEKRASGRLISPVSLNPWNVNTQIKELERLDVTDPVFHGLMRKVAAAPNKRMYVESAMQLTKYASQSYKDGKATYKVADADGWRQRNWAIASATLTVLSDKTIIRLDRSFKWLATDVGKKALLEVKAAMSATNVAGNYVLLYSLAGNLEQISGLPEQQLASLERLDARLKDIVQRRNEAKKELARFS